MHDTEGSLSELFGSTLEEQPPAPPRQFQDGVYVIRGREITHGRYRSGKHQGRPYARFLYDLVSDEFPGRQVSQMLLWSPTWNVFKYNFQVICGMSLEEFLQHCKAAGMDQQQQASFFLSRFRGVEFEAEVRRRLDDQGREWLNVWELKRRLGSSDQPVGDPAGLAAPQAPGQGDELEAEIETLRTSLGMDPQALDALCEEEFSAPYAMLGTGDRQMLAELLRERRMQANRPDPAASGAPESDASAGGEDLPF